MYSIKNREDLETLNELISLQGHVKVLRVQDKLRKEIFRGDMRKSFETVTETIKNVSKGVTRTTTEIYIENNKALATLNRKLLEIKNDSGILASYLLSPLSKITNLEQTSQFRVVTDPSSDRVNGLLKNKTIPVTLYNNLLLFRDTDKKFELQGVFLKNDIE